MSKTDHMHTAVEAGTLAFAATGRIEDVVLAAVPHLRDLVADEIEAWSDRWTGYTPDWYNAMEAAASIARGEEP